MKILTVFLILILFPILNPGDLYSSNLSDLKKAGNKRIPDAGLEGNSESEYFTEVDASVDEPEIYVGDQDFGPISVGKSVPYNISIENLGTADLKIFGYEDNSSGVFTHDLKNLGISKSNPLIIKPGAKKVFQVYFKPDLPGEYLDSIVFESNAGTNRDNVCIFKGLGIQPALEANGYDWGKVRIDRPEFPVSPYATQSGNPAIQLENTGTEDVRVESINIEELNPGDLKQFILPDALKYGFTLKPGESRLFEVLCHPTTTGEHQISITYTNSANSKTLSILKCVGILPKITTEDVNFGSVDIGNSTIITKEVKLTNLPYEYADTVTITDFSVSPAGSISKNKEEWGSDGFNIDVASSGLPRKVAPGESLVLTARFKPQGKGAVSAKLTTISDALEEATSTFYATGTSFEDIDVNVTTGIASIGDNDTIFCSLENILPEMITITGISLEPDHTNFAFVNPGDANGFDLQVMEKRIIKILYSPVDKGDHTTDLVINSTLLKTPVIRVPIKGTSLTGVDDIPEGNALIRSVYPNPAGDKLALSFNRDMDPGTRIIIYNLSGTAVMENVIKIPISAGGIITIDTKGIAPGMYFLKVLNGKNTDYCKIIIAE